jgi:UDP-glucose 4-epimerase
MRDIDVGATETLVRLCVEHRVEHLTVTTSGAAYGYHADNPAWIDEEAAIRGNVEFAYSDHKRQIEELLAKTRAAHPELKLLILRPGTILGRSVSNQITALFAKPRVLGIVGSDSPFVFIWDEDVVRILVRGVTTQAVGAFNLAGDGALSMREIAQRLNKPYLPIPAWLLRGVLTVLHPLRLIQYGPEQVGFLQYRPVLANTRLKRDFGYTPQMSSAEAFAALLEAQPGLVRAR